MLGIHLQTSGSHHVVCWFKSVWCDDVELHRSAVIKHGLWTHQTFQRPFSTLLLFCNLQPHLQLQLMVDQR